MNQVHKEQLEKVENALENRSDPNIEIFGTEGIPDDVSREHQQRTIREYHENAAARQASTGNPQPGSKDGPAPKRPKLEEKGDLKKKLAEFKAKKAAQAATNPAPGGTVQSPGAAHVSPYGHTLFSFPALPIRTADSPNC